MDQQEYIDELIIKCLSGEAGVDESKELSRWMDADKEHLAYFLKMKNIWDISHPAFDIESIQPQYRLEQLLEKIKGRQRRNRLEIFVRTTDSRFHSCSIASFDFLFGISSEERIDKSRLARTECLIWHTN